jgi:hypothetical protein
MRIPLRLRRKPPLLKRPVVTATPLCPGLNPLAPIPCRRPQDCRGGRRAPAAAFNPTGPTGALVQTLQAAATSSGRWDERFGRQCSRATSADRITKATVPVGDVA